MDEAVRELRGAAPREEIEPDVQLPLPAFLPDPYVPDVHQRLWLYKRLAEAGSDEELEEVRAEIVDRYGEPPPEVDALLEVMAVRVRLRTLRIRGLEAGPGRLVFALGPDAALDPFLLARHVQSSRGSLRLTPEMKLVAVLGDGARKPPAAPRAEASPAAAAALGMDLLRAAREVLSGLAGCARAADIP
jgi:transcription-repair coupling factor (superfamily II helicase)